VAPPQGNPLAAKHNLLRNYVNIRFAENTAFVSQKSDFYSIWPQDGNFDSARLKSAHGVISDKSVESANLGACSSVLSLTKRPIYGKIRLFFTRVCFLG
jgi:hypothetical protein